MTSAQGRSISPPSKPGCGAPWADADHNHVLDQIGALARELDRSHPGIAVSLRAASTRR